MNKKKLLLVLALVAVVLFLLLRNNSHEGTDTKENKETPAATQDETEIAILSVNDMHASIDQFPKFATMVDSLRGIYPDMLLFSAGDNRTGNPVNAQSATANNTMIELRNRTVCDHYA